MHIDEYEFGRIIVDGIEYTSDCLIVGGAVQPGWWRRQGHLLLPDDLELVFEHSPRALVVGRGASGRMRVDPTTARALHQNGINMEAMDTGAAVERFNVLSREGADVAAALHLTC